MRNSIGRMILATAIAGAISIGALRAAAGDAALTQGAKRSMQVQAEKDSQVGWPTIRTKSDGANARRRAAGDRYLPAEECDRASANYLGAYPVQF